MGLHICEVSPEPILFVHIRRRSKGTSSNKLVLALLRGPGMHTERLIQLKVQRSLWGWSGGAKVSCTLRHRGIQLILAYSWARPAILVAGKGRRGMFLFLLFLHFHSCSSFFPVLSFISSTISSISSPFLWEMTQNDPQGLTCR